MSEDVTAHIEKSKKEYYEIITGTEGSPFFGHRSTDVFVAAAAIGYHMEKREPVKDKHDLFRTFTISKEENRIWVLKSIAIAVEGIDVLNDLKKIIKIGEEFANSGIDYLFEIHTDGSDVVSHLSETMIEILEK
jgi:hypothetical protein